MGGLSILHVAILVLVVYLPLFFYVRTFIATANMVAAAGGVGFPANWAWLLLVPGLGALCYFVLLFRLESAVRRAQTPVTNSLWLKFGIIAGILGVLTASAPMLGFAFVVFAILHWNELAKLKRVFQQSRNDSVPAR